MSNLILATASRNSVQVQLEKSAKMMQAKTYEQQNIEFANFILKHSKKGGKQ